MPRSTEAETWDFVLDECQKAADNLLPGDGSHRRATKYAALALKSRAALHAASVAKFWNNAPLSGEAVEKKLVGMDASLANEYYQQCIDASAEIMNSGTFSLFRPNPSSPEEAAENYRLLFENPNDAPEEAIFIKGSAIIGNNHTANNYEIWYNPNQLANGWPHPGRYNPTLDWADMFETYDNPGVSTKLKTVANGDENYEGFDASRDYIKYDTPNEVYKGKDARLWGTAILPGTIWKDTKIVIQAGLITPDGTPKLLQGGSVTVDGEKYYTYGSASASEHSGFNPAGGNHTRTGMSFKKFLNEPIDVNPAWNQGTLDFIDIRYAEVLLNYAEAVVESGLGDAGKAKNALNDIRRRAGHASEIDLTI
ncbi:MAG TPA: RagB/SusD family nutrient uptake outer membrane protein, partial [Bacteroidales bacterium]|nr:RagB/SusD family nutrient uptake outer membrane protein [Bacteroidales bacterium]